MPHRQAGRSACFPLAWALLGAFSVMVLSLQASKEARAQAVTSPPVAISSAAPDREALIVSFGRAPAQADAGRYRDLLRLLGFRVTQVRADTRPDLKHSFAEFADHVKPGSDVAVFMLGIILPKGDDLYLFASETDSPLDQYAAEGLRLADAMRPIAQRGARDTVLLVDACRSAHDQICHVGARTVPDNISAIVGVRIKPEETSAPVAGLTSLGDDMLALMQREGLSYLDLYGVLQPRLAQTNMRLSATPSLSRSFAFLPAAFMAGLKDQCNKVDPDASAEALRGGSVEPLVAACTGAAEKWSFSSWFKDRLAAVREQAAFQRATNGCPGDFSGAYLQAYPNGRYVGAVRALQEKCEAEQRRVDEPPQAESALAESETTTCTVGGLDPAGNNWLALRQAPSYQAPWSTTRMGPGTKVSPIGRSGEWLHVRLSSGEMGWANTKFLFCGTTPSDNAPPPAQDSGCFVDGLDPAGNNWLALRSSPSFQSPWSSTRMGPGTSLTVLEHSGEWLHVRLASGETGWANGRFVRCGR